MQTIEIKDIYGLLPRTDCGLCGNPSCRVFARRVYAKLQKPTACLCNQEANTIKIEELMRTGFSLVKKKGERRVVEFQPCGEYGKITLEGQLPTIDDSVFDLFDSEEMCLLLRSSSVFTDVKCSVESGYAMLNSLGSGVHLFKTGKMIVRRALDKASALKTLDSAKRVLWGSVICSCGNTASSYGGGSVKNCPQQFFPPLLWGLSKKDQEMRSLEEILPKVSTLESGKTFSKALGELETINVVLNNFIERVDKDAKIDLNSMKIQLDPKIDNINRLGVTFLTQTKRDEDASLGLILNGLALDLARISKSLSMHNKSEKHLLKNSLEIVVKGLQSLIKKEKSSDALERYKEFLEKWKESSKDTNIFKIAMNGSYIDAIISTKFPQ